MNEIKNSVCYKNVPVYLLKLQGDDIDFKRIDKITIKVGRTCFGLPGQLSYNEFYTQRPIEMYETIPVTDSRFNEYLKRRLTKEPYIVAARFSDLQEKYSIASIEPEAPFLFMERPFYQLVSVEQNLVKEEPFGLKGKIRNIIDHCLDVVVENEKEEGKRR
ncbi:MAG: hypothetical protein PHN72_05645 [Bacilli bacterium]|nr:hypothetical protein [Bacilli bacterium]